MAEQTAAKQKKIKVQGIEISIDPNVMDDMRVIDYLYQIQHTDDDEGAGALAIAPLFRLICGKSYAKVMKHLQEPDGRVPAEKAGRYLMEIIKQVSLNS